MTKIPQKTDQSAADQQPVPPTAVPPTAVPPTAVPMTAAPAILPQSGGIFILEGTTLTQVEGAIQSPLNAAEKDA